MVQATVAVTEIAVISNWKFRVRKELSL